MKGIVFCNKGIEDISALEIKEIIGKDGKIFDKFVEFEIDSYDNLCKIAYTAQSISKVLLFLGNDIKDIDLKDWLKDKKSFKVDGDIDEEEKGDIGGKIKDKCGNKVDLENPDIVVYIFDSKDKRYFCIDFSGKDLSKRSYRIFSSPRNIKSTIAYTMVRLSGFKKKEILVDPFCLSGSITIEAALYENNFPVKYFDKNELIFSRFIEFDFETIDKKMTKDSGNIYSLDTSFKDVDAAKKNAKIAGINKAINFSRKELDWLDTKFDKGKVDKIVTCLPIIGKYSDKKGILSIYKEFFHQAEFILSKKGSIVLCTKNPGEVKEKASKFKLSEEREVWQGKENFYLLKFLLDRNSLKV